jgi:splicing factor 3B subunit 2
VDDEEHAKIEADDGDEARDDGVVEDDSKPKRKYTKKERKQLKREKIAVLKQLVDRPDVVEVHDINAADPGLLVHLKSLRNTVPVPRHWCQRRKYLQGKRGIEKPLFELPGLLLFGLLFGLLQYEQAT